MMSVPMFWAGFRLQLRFCESLTIRVEFWETLIRVEFWETLIRVEFWETLFENLE